MARAKTRKEKWSDLEAFESVGVRLGSPYISIRPNGTLNLNSTFLRQAGSQIGDKDYVRLFYSRENSAIVLEFIKDGDLPGAIKLTGKKTANISVGAKSFFNYFRIDINKIKGRYKPELKSIAGKSDLWVISLGKQK